MPLDIRRPKKYRRAWNGGKRPEQSKLEKAIAEAKAEVREMKLHGNCDDHFEAVARLVRLEHEAFIVAGR
jgi:hypothetical protein